MNELFEDKTPTIEQGHHVTVKQGRTYNRSERRKGLFVIRNLTNNRFVKKDFVNKKFVDVDLKDSSVFTWDNVVKAVGEILVNAPNAKVEVRMVKRSKTSKKLIFE